MPNVPEKVISGGATKDWKQIFTWDSLLDKAASGIAGAVAGAALAQMMGPTPWEQQVSSDLRTIIAKLDDILAEVKALRDRVKDDMIALWRGTLKARLTTQIDSIEALIEGVRHQGSLQGNLRDQFNLGAVNLNTILGEIVNFREEGTNRPLAMPLYAMTASGVTMLVAAQCLLELPAATTSSMLDDFVRVFKEWKDETLRLAEALSAQYAADAAYLTNYPRTRGVCWSSKSGDGVLPFVADPPASLVNATLGGGTGTDFFVASTSLQVFDPMSKAFMVAGHIEPYFPDSDSEALRSYIDGPMPIYSGGAAHIVVGWKQVYSQDSAKGLLKKFLLGKLNQKRADTMEEYEALRGVYYAADSIQAAIDRFNYASSTVGAFLKHE